MRSIQTWSALIASAGLLHCAGNDSTPAGASGGRVNQGGDSATRGGSSANGGNAAGGANGNGGSSNALSGSSNGNGGSGQGGSSSGGNAGTASGGTSSGGNATQGGASNGGASSGGASSGGASSGGASNGGNAGSSNGAGGSSAQGGTASGGAASGGRSSGGTASGGTASGGAAGGGASSGGAASGGAGSTCTKHDANATFRNPLNTTQGSDPFMFYYNCNYYLTATTWNSTLTVKKAPTIAGLKTASAVTVWNGANDNAGRCCNFWAPEIHQLNGPNGLRWYFYYTAGPAGTDTGNQRNYVLESAGTDPMGPYTFKARIYDTRNDFWAIDPSVVTINGSLYFLFSAWEGEYQNIFIAAMSNPWTMSGSRVRLSQASYSWETQLANVNEGPVALQHGGKTFITYSASACWGPEYKLGMLTLTGTNPLSASSWSKSSTPVFQRADANSVYGPAHNGFFKSPDGTEDWIVYHANASSSGVCDTRRTTRAQKINWNSDGTPNFGAPVSTTTDVRVPAGE
ncbi:MAG: glycoside hydrolase family 43 protein [Polyangiaceae bacterium]